MDYNSEFAVYFDSQKDYNPPEIQLNKKLQDTRHALQEANSEIDSLKNLIEHLYSESRIENVATSQIVNAMHHKLFSNMPLPRNADTIPIQEKAGYIVFYMKFLGYATRVAAEEYHKVKDHLEGMHKSVEKQTLQIEIPRSSELKIPALDGKQEMKRSVKPTTSQPSTPVLAENKSNISRKSEKY